MTKKGKKLEELVAFVEETLQQKGLTVKTNDRLYDDKGVQIAEFDVTVSGKLGTTKMNWLIECRDRPSQGASPGEWIQQLVGKQAQFGFNKVTAVSTTGFSPSAVDCANKNGIELREVRELAAEYFSDWIAMKHMSFISRVYKLTNCNFGIENLSEDVQKAFKERINTLQDDEPFLLSTKWNEKRTPPQAFHAAISSDPKIFEGVLPNQPAKKVAFAARYSEDDRFLVETSLGLIPIKEIKFKGKISLVETLVPPEASEYKDSKTGEIISQVASFNFKNKDQKISVEMHRIPETGFTHFLLKTKSKDKKKKNKKKK